MSRGTRRLRGQRPGTVLNLGSSDPKIAAALARRSQQHDVRQAAAGQTHSDVDPSGESVAGNLDDETVPYTFKQANIAYLVPHTFGRVVRNWRLVDKTAKIDVWRDATRGESNRGVWLVCDTADTSVRIRFDGQRHSA